MELFAFQRRYTRSTDAEVDPNKRLFPQPSERAGLYSGALGSSP